MLADSAAWFGARMGKGLADDELAGIRDDLKRAGLARAVSRPRYGYQEAATDLPTLVAGVM